MNLGLLLLATIAAGPSAAPRSGFEFFARTRTQGNLSSAVAMADSTVHGWAAGPAARFEITESRNPMLPAGAVLLSADGGRTAVFVSPKGRSVHPWLVQIPKSNEVSGRERTLSTRTIVRNLAIDKLVDEPGEKIGGFSTRHLRFRVAYDLASEVNGDTTETSTIRIDELWTAPKLDLPGTSIWLRRDPPETGDPDADKRLSEAYAKATGMLVKRVTTSSLSSPAGALPSTTTSWEVTKLRAATIPSDLFEPPAPAPTK